VRRGFFNSDGDGGSGSGGFQLPPTAYTDHSAVFTDLVPWAGRLARHDTLTSEQRRLLSSLCLYGRGIASRSFTDKDADRALAEVLEVSLMLHTLWPR
jgi:hypothetical protein